MTKTLIKPAIRIDCFSKSFGVTRAVNSLSFEVFPGEIFGFLGRNGAGKTTTIRTLLRIYEPDQGNLFLRGLPFTESRAHEVGYLPEERGLYTRASIWDTLIYMGRLRSVPRDKLLLRTQEYLERFDLWEIRHKKIQNLSSGMQQKVQIIATLLHEPPVLILDEPFRGLDPINRQLVFDILQEKKSAGACILFSSHQILEIEDLCDRVILIAGGESKAYGSVEEVQTSFAPNVIGLRFSGPLPSLGSEFKIDHKGNRAEIHYSNPEDPKRILSILLKSEINLHHFEIKKPSLHSVFLHLCS